MLQATVRQYLAVCFVKPNLNNINPTTSTKQHLQSPQASGFARCLAGKPGAHALRRPHHSRCKNYKQAPDSGLYIVWQNTASVHKSVPYVRVTVCTQAQTHQRQEQTLHTHSYLFFRHPASKAQAVQDMLCSNILPCLN